MINCQNTQELLSQRLDGEINEKENAQLAEHLATCSICQEYEAGLINLHTSLINIPQISLNESILDNLITNKTINFEDKDNSKTPRKSVFKPWYGLIAAAILIGIYIPVSGLVEPNNSNDVALRADSEATKIAAAEENPSVEFDVVNEEGSMGALNSDTETADAEGDKSIAIASEPNDSTQFFIVEDNVKIENRQLIIFDNNNMEIYRTNQWDENLIVRWYILDDNHIIYTLFDNQNKKVGEYKINISEKIEEKVEE